MNSHDGPGPILTNLIPFLFLEPAPERIVGVGSDEQVPAIKFRPRRRRLSEERVCSAPST